MSWAQLGNSFAGLAYGDSCFYSYLELDGPRWPHLTLNRAFAEVTGYSLSVECLSLYDFSSSRGLNSVYLQKEGFRVLREYILWIKEGFRTIQDSKGKAADLTSCGRINNNNKKRK